MKFLQKTWFAWLLTALMIVAAVGIGQAKGRQPEPLSTGSTALDRSEEHTSELQSLYS